MNKEQIEKELASEENENNAEGMNDEVKISTNDAERQISPSKIEGKKINEESQKEREQIEISDVGSEQCPKKDKEKEIKNEEQEKEKQNLLNFSEKKQSLLEEIYPQIDKEEQMLEKENNQVEEEKEQNCLKKSLVINIEENQAIPSVVLEPSPRGKKPLQVKIAMYNINTFFKIQTQVFIVDVHDPTTSEEYQINRRYSDFVSFYESLFYNQIGYILCPFPEKSFDSFFKIKFGLASYEGQKQELIEKRMAELEKFTNFVAAHKQLSNSEELAVFLQQNEQDYEKGKKRLEKYVEEYKNLESLWNVKNFVEKGASFLTSYLKTEKKLEATHLTLGKNDIEFGIILENVRSEQNKHKNLLKSLISLQKAQKNLGQFSDIETDIDVLLQVSAKHTSGRHYSLNFSYFLENFVIDNLDYSIRSLEEVQKILLHRVEVIEVAEEGKKKGQLEKSLKLQRRIELFERNFLFEWQTFNQRISKKFLQIMKSFQDEWATYRGQMQKVWRKRQ